MIKPTKGHWKALERVVSYVLHEPQKGLVLAEEASKPQAIYTWIQIMQQARMTK